jgi:hypothetical protein
VKVGKFGALEAGVCGSPSAFLVSSSDFPWATSALIWFLLADVLASRNWELGDGQAPTGLYRKGWRKDDLKVGDTITVTGATRSWNGDYRIGGGVITNAAGQKLFTGSKDDSLDTAPAPTSY